ncbi:hypothetical protein Trydic_g18930 [Trypoxylus dichotomus]
MRIFVPHQLNEDQAIARIADSREIIETAENDPDFLDSIRIADETWCLSMTPKLRANLHNGSSKANQNHKKCVFGSQESRQFHHVI